MTPYLISYDLDKPSQNYAALSSYLTRIGAVRVLESEWVVKSDANATTLRDAIITNGKMGASDRILVVGINGAAWRNLLIADRPMYDAI